MVCELDSPKQLGGGKGNMAFYKLKEHATPGICEPRLLDEQERKQIQHQIANHVKQCIKEKFDKGPEAMQVTIAGDMIIIKSGGYLTRIEKYIIEKEPGGAETVRSIRADAVAGIVSEGELIAFLEQQVGAKATYSMHDSYPQDEYCIWIFLFDRQLA